MSRAVNLAALVLASSAGPGFAQSHADHAAHMGHHTATPQSECQAEAARHRAMGHAVPEDSCAPENSAPVDHADMDHGAMDHNAMDHASMGHGQMDHATMDHSGMDHSDMNHGSVSNQSPEIPIAPPPASAGSGPPTAADAIWALFSIASNTGRTRARTVICGTAMPGMAATSTGSGSNPKAKERSARGWKAPMSRCSTGARSIPISISRRAFGRI